MFKMSAVCSDTHKLQERVYREKIRTADELQQRITEEWERLGQRVINNAVKQHSWASIPPEAMVRPPKMAGWVPQFLIIMHLKCCADR